MSGFSDSLQQNTEYRSVLQEIEGKFFPFGVLGALHIQKAFLLHGITEDTGRRAMVLLPDEASADKMAEDLRSFGTTAAVFPAK
ncbi:MAG TPA: hypothetical protein PLS28_01660, partial [Clostridiales bacterium]|nr:hypothetical protein [Clostridiales bacterium]